MEVKLIVATGKSAGKEIPVAGPKFLIGRSEDCHMRPTSDQVSRHHCVLLIEGGDVLIRDLGSKNGTLVNGERVRTERELKMGDRISIGPLEFEVRLIVDVGGKKRPKVKSIEEAAARTLESSSSGSDDDVADWLMDNDEEPDTDTIDLVPTQKADADPFENLVPGQAEPGEKEEREVKIPGKFEAAKAAAESSRDAAAQTLRQMFHRK